MNYDNLIKRAIENDEIENLLCGSKTYEVTVSEFTSDVFLTDINSVLVNCFYKQFNRIEKIDQLFENCLQHMLEESACNVYIAVLYFDTCIFQEEINGATFFVNKEILSAKIKEAVRKNKDELSEFVIFQNGMKKNNPLKNIEHFSRYYEKKYHVRII